MLPQAGRQGPPPPWPLTEEDPREAVLWERLWAKPQALMWERYGQETEVALYVRRFAEAEERESSVALSTLIRQLADSLGLTTPGMRANRWRIVADESASTGVRRPSTTKRPSALSRLKVVPHGDPEA